MLSIFLIYSKDRRQQLDISLSCLRDMKGYNSCQKILCADVSTDIYPPDFEVVIVPRNGNLFNWAAVWNAGIAKAEFDKILYLDSDRILPTDYLLQVDDRLIDNQFLYSSTLVRVSKHQQVQLIKTIRDNPIGYKSYYYPEQRIPHPPNLNTLSCGKNPMSGNTAFTKKTWDVTGGIDPAFEGWGYPDTEYYFRCYKMGMSFDTIPCTELHLYHEYSINSSLFEVMNLWNAVKLSTKLNMELDAHLKGRIASHNLTVEDFKKRNTLDKFLLYLERGKHRKILI